MRGGSPVATLLLLSCLLRAAVGCNVCARLTEVSGVASGVDLDAAAAGAEIDVLSCQCDFVFSYSAGPTLGRLAISTGGVGAVTVYDGPSDVLAEFSSADALDGAVLFSRTGVFRVSFVTDATATVPGAPTLVLTVAAVNQPPTFEEREDLVFVGSAAPAGFHVIYPWSPAGHPLPVSVRDYDNFDGNLRAELTISSDPGDEALYGLVVPATAGITFEEGSPGAVERRVVLDGPTGAVEEALAAARLVAFEMEVFARDTLVVAVSDSELETATYEMDVGVYASGIVDMPRGTTRLNSGSGFARGHIAEAVFLVHDAVRVVFRILNLQPNNGEGCAEYVRVWDGPDTATGRLLSTDLVPTGEICSFGNELLPTYVGTTGEFVVELFAVDQDVSSFDAGVMASPVGFRVWILDGDRVLQAVAGGANVAVPPVMVTSLPDPAQIAVNATAAVGTVTLLFADSFVDIVLGNADNTLSLAVESQDGEHVMLRMGDALRDLMYVAPAGYTGPDTVTVRAWSGGIEAAVLQVAVEVSTAAINAPDALSLHAFRPVPIPVTVALDQDAGAAVVAVVSTSSGTGKLSLDHRAGVWVDIGYADEVTASGTLDDVNAQLGDLVYKGMVGGTDRLTVTVGGTTKEIVLTVDPECDGSHVLYGRAGTVTDRAGPDPPSAPFSPDILCGWIIHGARHLEFPFYDIAPRTSAFTIFDHEGKALYFNALFDPPPITIRGVPLFDIQLAGLGENNAGFVAAFDSLTVDDPPVLVVPDGVRHVVRGTTVRIRGLYIDDFAEGVIRASLETNVGSLQTPGTQLVAVEAATFEELDAWVTGIDFLAGDRQARATLVLRASDALEQISTAQFQFEVLPCSGTAEVVLEDGSATAAVSDGSGPADYVDGLACGWRLTGAPAPAALEVVYLDLDCSGDAVTVYDGSSVAGRKLGSFCQADDVAAEVGTLVSTTGSFFVQLLTNVDELVDDGFSFVYGAVASGAATDLGSAHPEADPERADAAVIALDSSRVAVFGGHNGVRAVPTTLMFDVGDGWRLLAGSGPTARSRAAGAALSASQIVVHGGEDARGATLSETWIGEVDGTAVQWSQLAATGPRTAAAAMIVHDGAAHLVDASGVWILGDDDNRWSEIGTTPAAIVPTTSAYREADGLVYATGTDGAVWTLSLATGTWTPLDATLDVECAPWTCSGAMLGPDEYVVGGSRVNVTSLAVSALPAAATGQMVGGQYLGQPSLFVFGGGAMAAVPLTLGVSSHGPLVSPTTGGTTITLSGEQLSTCAAPMCDFGSSLAPAAVATERSASCTTPVGAAATVLVTLACGDGRRYSSPDPLAYFAEPTIESVDPANPDPGDLVALTLGGIAEATLALVDTPLCRFNGIPVEAVVDGQEIRCRVSETTPRGSRATVEISLDGQQFGSSTEVQVAKGRGPLFDKSRATIGGFVLAGGLLLIAVALYRKTPNRPPRTVILSVSAAIVDLYLDIVFASKLRDEGSPLSEWAFGSVTVLVLANLVLVVAFVLRKTRHKKNTVFVEWLERTDGAVVALSLVCVLGMVRVSALALLMTRLGGRAQFDASGLSDKDWHLLAALDLTGTIFEDLAQLAIQIVYLSGPDARVDIVTVVTVSFSVIMILYACFSGLARIIVLRAVRTRAAQRRIGAAEWINRPSSGELLRLPSFRRGSSPAK